MNHKFFMTFAVLAVAIVGASCYVMADADESDAASLTIGVGVYSGSGTVTVYDKTSGTTLYSSSATGVHEVTIPSGHSFSVTASPSSGYQFDKWVTEQGGSALYDNPINSSTDAHWDVNTLAYFIPQSTTNYTVTIREWPSSSAGTVNMTSVTVPSGTSYSAVGNVLTIGSYTITATPASGYYFWQWSSDTGSVSSDRTISAMFQREVTYYTVSFAATPSGSGSVSTSSVTVAEGTSYSTNGNVLTIGSYTITATPASGYQFSRWSSSSGSIYSNTGITATFTSTVQPLTIGVGVYSGSGTVTVYDITASTSLYNSSATGVHEVTIPGGHQFRLSATPETGYQFVDWRTEQGGSVDTRNPIEDDTSSVWPVNTLAYFTAIPTPQPLTIGVGVYSGSGTVSVYDITASQSLYSSSASGVHEVTIPAGHQFRLTATPASGYQFVDWRTEQGGSVDTRNPIEDDTSSVWPVNTLAYFREIPTLTIGVGVIATSTGTGTVTVYDITASTTLYSSSATGVHEVTIPAGHQFRLSATPDTGSVFVNWRDEQNHSVSDENPMVSDTSAIWDNNTLAYFTDSGYVVTIVPTPANGGTVSRDRVVVEGPTTYSVNGDTLTIGTTTIRASAALGYAFSFWSPDGGVISADLTIYAHFAGADSTYWYNKNYNGSVSMLFDLTGSNTSQTISAAIYSGSVVNSMPIWSTTGLTLVAHVDYSGGQAHVGVELLRGTAVVQTNKIGSSWPSIGAWKQIMVTLDTEHGRVNVTPVRTMASFTDYTLYDAQTSTAMDFSRHLQGTANATLVLQHDVGAGTPPKFSVAATRPFLDTYGAVMIDPSIDVAHYYPQYDSVRLNFYSFALYGDSITLNGVTWQVDGSKVTIPYVNDRDGKHYTPSLIPDADVLTKTLELNNIYVSWDHLTGKCSVTFVSDRWTIDLGDYRNKQISFEGMWYFTTMLYEPSITTEKALGEWKTLPETNESQMLLIYLGVLTVAGVAGIIHVRRGGHATLDLLVIAAAGVVGYVMLG